MHVPPLTDDEPMRLQALSESNLLDSPIEQRFERITRLAQRALNVPIVAVSLLDSGRQWFKSIQGLDVTETSRDVSFCGHTILNHGILIVEDARKDERFHENPLVTCHPNIVFYAGYPVKTPDGSRIGTLCIIDTKPRVLDDEDIQTIRDLTEMIEYQIGAQFHDAVQAELMTQLTSVQRESMVDPLTRLWNREGLGQGLDAKLDSCIRESKPIAVMMLDVDRFKSVNDNYGHQVGDEVLREVARRILNAMRDCDTVGRFGGEEFLVAIDRAESTDTTWNIAERIRTSVAQASFETESGPLDVTLSIGVALISDPTKMLPEYLIRNADEALYESKSTGRNKTTLRECSDMADVA